jgi:hypothetical protein
VSPSDLGGRVGAVAHRPSRPSSMQVAQDTSLSANIIKHYQATTRPSLFANEDRMCTQDRRAASRSLGSESAHGKVSCLTRGVSPLTEYSGPMHGAGLKTSHPPRGSGRPVPLSRSPTWQWLQLRGAALLLTEMQQHLGEVRSRCRTAVHGMPPLRHRLGIYSPTGSTAARGVLKRRTCPPRHGCAELRTQIREC